MKIAIIGAGFTGLTAAYRLTRAGHQVTVFEKDTSVGGLAIGYKRPEWEWTLEHHYHHWFTNDNAVLDLAREIGHTVIIRRPITASFVEDHIYQLDSPVSVLTFPRLPLVDRLRMGVSLALLRYNPFWHMLEHYHADPYLRITMGERAYGMLWEPLMVNKLGRYAHDVSLAWFWARVYKRTPQLAYPDGGFLAFAQHLQQFIEHASGEFIFNAEIHTIAHNKSPQITYSLPGKRKKTLSFDRIIATIPAIQFARLTPSLPVSYTQKIKKLNGIGAMNLVLRLKKDFFPDKTYWLSMCDMQSPILAIVEHTHFMDKKHYNNENLVYIGSYLETTDPKFSMTPEELLKLYDPWLKRINPHYTDALIGYDVFKAPFAQPIIPPNYSKDILPLTTPLRHVYLANMQQVYPWDRGTNYAVALGEQVAAYATE